MIRRGWKLAVVGAFIAMVGVSLQDAPISAQQTPAAGQAIPRIERPEGIQKPEECIKCHAKVTPGVVAAFLQSTMGRTGIQNREVYQQVKKAREAAEKKEGAFKVEQGRIQCVHCHGEDHDQINETQGRVQDAVCGGCHKQVYEDYELVGGHSYSPPEEVWRRAVEAPQFATLPLAILKAGRDLRYSQQGATNPPYFDLDPESEGSGLVYRNGCDSCHTRHTFSAAEARKPESCQTCHMGVSDPIYDAYISSKHGVIYKTESARWNWELTLPQAFLSSAYTTPTCAFCHMLVAERYGEVRSTHNMTRKSIWERGLQAATVKPDEAKDADAYRAWFERVLADRQSRRKEMATICASCHTPKFAEDYLSTADEVKYNADLLVLTARRIIEGLYTDGLIKSANDGVSGAGGGGQKGDVANKNNRRLEPLAWHQGVSEVERLYFDMFFTNNPKTYKGVFHISPNYVLWNGYAELEKDLIEIKAKANELRQKGKTSDQ